MGDATNTLQLSSALTGGNLRGMTIFSIGLSPWMSSMLLWRMFSVSKRFSQDRVPTEILERRKMYLTLAIAAVQALAVALYLPYQTSSFSTIFLILLNTVILIAGAFLLVWLADLNSSMGIGSSTVIMLASMVLYMPTDIATALNELNLSINWLWIIAFSSLFFLYIAIIFEKSKYRIPINRLGIHNDFETYSYLDIKLNPAGGMPIMYAMTLVSLPQYVLLLLAWLLPGQAWPTEWATQLRMGSLPWLLLYIFVIFLLGIAFAFINVNGDEISEKMEKSGEYIDKVYPGAPTRRYINRIVSRFALIGSFYLLVFAAGPMIPVLWDMLLLRLAMVPGMFMIFMGMVFTMQDEIKALKVNENYKTLF
ncbi:Preprotein translocase SecY2 subunit [Streptococcus sp. DD10]|nr:Preprotein translocase SecY2 subunit [Streptococcus sp. DD10]